MGPVTPKGDALDSYTPYLGHVKFEPSGQQQWFVASGATARFLIDWKLCTGLLFGKGWELSYRYNGQLPFGQSVPILLAYWRPSDPGWR